LLQHVVFRLEGSLPVATLDRLKADCKDQDERRDVVHDELDRCNGPDWLRDAACARIVCDALTHFDRDRYHLLAWCVMPNHVHVLMRQAEGWPLAAVVKSWKSFSARAINRALDRSGPLWAADYFDRYVRSDEQASAAIAYVENNPVKAGLCVSPADWPWSSASLERGRPRPRTSYAQDADLEVRAPFSEF